MFWNKTEQIAVRTRLKNEDHFKIINLVEMFGISNKICQIAHENDDVTISFEIQSRRVEKFLENLYILNVVGIYGERI